MSPVPYTLNEILITNMLMPDAEQHKNKIPFAFGAGIKQYAPNFRPF